MKLLDLFCGAGGAAVGYYRSGFTDITGIDNRPQKHYPFRFIQTDALKYLAEHGHEYDVIHASPPCRAFARIGHVHGRCGLHPKLVDATRDALILVGNPWIIENVPDSKLPTTTILCGSMFSLGAIGPDGVYRQLRRHRLFESPVAMLTPACSHNGEPIGVYGRGGPQRAERKRGYMGGKRERQEAMQIDWMDTAELSNAIPPAYTLWIGTQLMKVLDAVAVQTLFPDVGTIL